MKGVSGEEEYRVGLTFLETGRRRDSSIKERGVCRCVGMVSGPGVGRGMTGAGAPGWTGVGNGLGGACKEGWGGGMAGRE